MVQSDSASCAGYWEEVDGVLSRFGEAAQFWDPWPARWLVRLSCHGEPLHVCVSVCVIIGLYDMLRRCISSSVRR